jgi:hypothetical protein
MFALSDAQSVGRPQRTLAGISIRLDRENPRLRAAKIAPRPALPKDLPYWGKKDFDLHEENVR